MKLSKLGIGTFKISDKKIHSQKDIINYIIFAHNFGVNLIDTSDSYGNGYIESILGKVFKKKMIERNQIYVSTKFGQKISFSLNDVIISLESSLKRLNSDYIDFYFFHSGSNAEFDNDRLWTYLNKKKEEGVIHNLGLAIKNEYLIEEDFFQLEKIHQFNIDALSIVHNKNFSKLDKLYDKYMRDIKIFSRVPLSKGNLTDYDHSMLFQNTSKDISFLNNIPSIKNLLWSLNNPKIDTTLVGFSNFEQLSLNLISYHINKLSFDV